MWTVEQQFRVRLGGNIYINVPKLVVYEGHTLFTLRRNDDNEELGIYFELYDSTGRHLASVKRNQIYVTGGAAELYSLEGSADEYILREKASDQPVCRIRRRGAAPVELEVSVRLYTPDGSLFDATPAGTNLPGGNLLSDSIVQNCPVGINIAASGTRIG